MEKGGNEIKNSLMGGKLNMGGLGEGGREMKVNIGNG